MRTRILKRLAIAAVAAQVGTCNFTATTGGGAGVGGGGGAGATGTAPNVPNLGTPFLQIPVMAPRGGSFAASGGP